MNTNDLERIVTEIAETVGERQGWSVFSCYGSARLGDGLAVQRIDDAEILDSDDDAIRLARAAGINCDDEGRVIGLHPGACLGRETEKQEVDATKNRFKSSFDNWPILDGREYIEADLGASVTVRAYVELDQYATPEADRPDDIAAFDADRLRYCSMKLNVYLNGACVERSATSLHQIGIDEDADNNSGYLTECANDLLDQIDVAAIIGGFAKQATAAARKLKAKK